jgi:hypothetical protein
VSRRPGFIFNRGRVAAVTGDYTPPSPGAWDLTALDSASSLQAWWDASSGVTMSATPLTLGTTPPAVTFSGPGLADASGRAIYLHVEELDVTKFRWNDYAGGGIGRGNGERNVPIPAGGSYVLGATGVTANFAAGPYVTDNSYQARAASVSALYGGASMLLDNSSVYASLGPVIGIDRDWADARPALNFSPFWNTGGLGNTTGVPAIATGLNTPFHIFQVCQVTSSNISTGGNTLFGFSHSTTTNGNYLDWRFYGPLSTVGAAGPGAQHMMVKRIAAGTAPTGLKQFGTLTEINYGPMLIDAGYDGTTMEMRINGQLFATSSDLSTTSLTLQRFMIGAIKLGTSGAANVAYMRWNATAIYNTKLAETEAGAWGVRRALA